jgi:hypothetical protein
MKVTEKFVLTVTMRHVFESRCRHHPLGGKLHAEEGEKFWRGK